MMVIIKALWLVYILLASCKLTAQKNQTTKVSQVKTADTLNDYLFRNLINFPSGTVKLSEFKNKMVILDFWSTRCASCIESWPKLLSLQEQFKDNLQIILVNTYQDEKTVRPIIEKRIRAGINMTLPIVCGDSVLGKMMFPHTSEPHVVWIDQNRKVVSITGGETITKQNIERMLDAQSVTMRQKDDFYHLPVDFSKPLFVNGNAGNGEHIQWQSVLSGYFDGLFGTTHISADSVNGFAIRALNTSVIGFHRFIYGEGLDEFGFVNWVPVSRVRLELNDSLKYAEKINDEIQYQNYYSYQLHTTRHVTKEELVDGMKVDLERYFHLHSRWEKKKVKCLVLTAHDTSLVAYKKRPGGSLITDVQIELNNVTTEYFLKFLTNATKYHNSPFPIVDETGMKGKLGGIKIECDIYDYEAVDRELWKKYKMHFSVAERLVDVLVITDAGRDKSPE